VAHPSSSLWKSVLHLLYEFAPFNKAMKSDAEKRGSNFRCTFLASTFIGSAESAALFDAADR
jgi:hypothetical protein